ncbi:MAG: hypothetical protein PF501_16325 [Salinisphaera sp.]|nr:hypothetical protein [Salinisphaera sp.]
MAIGLGAIIGVVITGRLADHLIAAGGMIPFTARRTYPRDAATTLASEHSTQN